MSKEKRLNLCGIHLKNIREQKKLTLSDIQATLEVDYGIFLDRTNLGRIESGSRRVSDIELVILAHLFDVSLEQLLWGNDQPHQTDIDDFLKKVQVSNATRRGSTAKNT